jgi:hypothetical protein
MRFLLLIVTAATLGAQQTATSPRPPEAGDGVRGYTDTPRLPGQTWRVHDADRPRPKKVAPGPLVSAPPPSDAIVLFDGKDLSIWVTAGRGGQTQEPKWKVESGYMEIVPRSGRLVTKEKFGDCQLHIEWMIPAGSPGKGQDHGNSGVEIMMRYEVQVLESFENVTYADGQAASLYGQWPPLVNASRPEGEWNVYDIMFEAPRFDKEKIIKPGYITVVHNGILVHNHQEILGATVHRKVAVYTPHGEEESLSLQDHGAPVHFRNIWIRRLHGDDQDWAMIDASG